MKAYANSLFNFRLVIFLNTLLSLLTIPIAKAGEFFSHWQQPWTSQ